MGHALGESKEEVFLPHHFAHSPAMSAPPDCRPFKKCLPDCTLGFVRLTGHLLRFSACTLAQAAVKAPGLLVAYLSTCRASGQVSIPPTLPAPGPVEICVSPRA